MRKKYYKKNFFKINTKNIKYKYCLKMNNNIKNYIYIKN